MTVTYIDPGEGALSKALTAFGTAAVNRINHQKIRERALADQPATLASLAPAARRAIQAGQLDAFAAALDVRPEFVQKLIVQAFQPTSAELEDIAFTAAGGPKAAGEAKAAGAKVTGETATTQLALRQPTLAVINDVSRLNLDQQYRTAQLALGIPELQANSEAAGFIFNEKSNTAQSEFLDLREQAGLPQLTVRSDVLKAQTEIASSKTALRAIDTYDNYIATLPNTPLGNHLRAMAAGGLTNPNFVNHVALHEQIDASTAAAQAKAGDPGDMLLVMTRWQEAMGKALERVKNAKNDDERFAARREVEMVRAYGMALQAEGAMLPFELTGARDARTWLGLRTKIKLFGVAPELVDKFTIAAKMVVDGEQTMEKLQESESFQALSPEDQARLVATITTMRQQIAQEDAQEAARSPGGLQANPYTGTRAGVIVDRFQRYLETERNLPGLSTAAMSFGTKIGVWLFSPPNGMTSDQIYGQMDPETRNLLDSFNPTTRSPGLPSPGSR